MSINIICFGRAARHRSEVLHVASQEIKYRALIRSECELAPEYHAPEFLRIQRYLGACSARREAARISAFS